MKRLIATAIIALALIPATAFAGKEKGTITIEPVPAPVYGGFAVATVTANPPATDYVFVKCHDDVQEVYARYFEVNFNNQAKLGPFFSSLWEGGPAFCTATHGYFTKDGFGRWVAIDSVPFEVQSSL